MKTFNVTRNDGLKAQIEADRFETDGAGMRFFDTDGKLVAHFAYGVIVEVTDSEIEFN